VGDAAREAAEAPAHIDFGARRLHWLKNVPEPVAARSDTLAERPAPCRPLPRLARLTRKPAGGTSIS